MKINQLGILFTLLFLIISSCSSKQSKAITNKEVTPVKEQTKVNPYNLIIGKWKMESYQVYSPNPDPTPKEEIIWEFKEKGEFITVSTGGKQSSMNTHRYWMNKSIININQQLYMYYFEEPLGLDRKDNAKPFGYELWLDSNLDPSISDHGAKIYFTRIQ